MISKTAIMSRRFVSIAFKVNGFLPRARQQYVGTSPYFHFRSTLHREELQTRKLHQLCFSTHNCHISGKPNYILSDSNFKRLKRFKLLCGCGGKSNAYTDLGKYHTFTESLRKDVNGKRNTGQINEIRNFNTHQSPLCSKETGDFTPKENGNEKDQKENIYTVPNLLTGFRIVITPYLGYLVLNGNFTVAMGLFVVAGITDGLDGYIARNFKNQSSTLGSLLDPLADKLLVGVLSVTLTMVNLIPVPLMLIMIGRDVSLIIASLVIKYRSIPPPRKLSKLFDARNATVQMLPSTLSKVNTAFQLTLLTASIGAPVFGYVDHLVLQTLWYITGATTIASGIGYAVTGKKNVKFLDKDKNDSVKETHNSNTMDDK